ncbi:MAG: hypothetical protein N2235_04090, partial [Fischerella sp.]|nr:hypothetical protein [Fischerella sp.]
VLFVVRASARKRQLQTPQSCFGKPLAHRYIFHLAIHRHILPKNAVLDHRQLCFSYTNSL